MAQTIQLNATPEVLRKRFYELATARDVADLLEVRYDRLVWHLYGADPEKRYVRFEVPKRSGGVREIRAPGTAIKILQRKLNQVLQSVYEPRDSVHGFVPNRSVRTNAGAHARRRYVLNVDLKEFFPSVNFGRVRGLLMAEPYRRPPEVATVLAQLACHDNQLPQGAPTSPVLANMVCWGMDSALQGLAKRCRATYTRYADDVTFSTNRRDFPAELAVVEGEAVRLGYELAAVIERSGFEPNTKKVRLQTREFRQEVTGLTVNVFPNVQRCYVRQIRAMLHAWRKFGLEAAEAEHRRKYAHEHRGPGRGAPSYRAVVEGKLAYLAMVRGVADPVYQTYRGQFDALSTAPPRATPADHE